MNSGNLNLANMLELRDIHLPDPAGWWPPAPGWWLLAIIVLVVVVWLIRLTVRFFKQRHWQRKLMKQFNSKLLSHQDIDDREFILRLQAQLKRLAITLYPTADVAALFGQAWLDFLNEHAGKSRFDQQTIKILSQQLYQPDPPPLDLYLRDQLLQQSRDWAKHNIKQSFRELKHAV